MVNLVGMDVQMSNITIIKIITLTPSTALTIWFIHFSSTILFKYQGEIIYSSLSRAKAEIFFLTALELEFSRNILFNDRPLYNISLSHSIMWTENSIYFKKYNS